MSIDDLPPLRDIIAAHGLMARKSLGQNFLLDLNLTRKIAAAAGDLEGRAVIEIGPGPGGLTRALLGTKAREVTAIEFDQRSVEALQSLVDVAQGRLHLLREDALESDYEGIGVAPRVIVANLPYNIATVLLIGWLRSIAAFESLTLMFQREVAERIVAPPGGKAYGRLAVMTGWLCEARIMFDIPARAFTPAPKVTSSVVRLLPRNTPQEVAFSDMETVVAAAFGQRRKMMRSALRVLGDRSDAMLEMAGIDPEIRAETLPVAAFVRLALAFRTLSGS